MTTTVALESLDHQSGPCIPLDVQTDDLLSRLLPAGGALAKMRPTETRWRLEQRWACGGVMEAVPAAGWTFSNPFNIALFMKTGNTM